MLSDEQLIEKFYAQKMLAAHDDSYNSTATKNLSKLKILIEFHNAGVVWDFDTYGIRLKNRNPHKRGFIVTFNGRWKLEGTGRWYRYGRPRSLVDKLYPQLEIRYVV